MRPSTAIRVSITPSLGIMGRTTTRRRRRSPTAGPANFYINSCSDLCSSPPADDPLFYELAHRIRCAFLIRVNLSSVLEFFLISGWGAWRDVAKGRRGEEREIRLRRLEHNPKREPDFFIWIRCNPLKSPESAKGIQENPRTFSWICLVFLGFICMDFALRLCRRLRDRFRRRGACSVQSIGALV